MACSNCQKRREKLKSSNQKAAQKFKSSTKTVSNVLSNQKRVFKK